MSPNAARRNNFAVNVRRRDVRIIARIPGRCSFTNRPAEPREFSCRVLNISQDAVGLAVPVTDELGDRVIAHIDHIGKIEGVIVHHFSRGIIVKIDASKEERNRLLDRIEWFEKYKNLDIPDHRVHRRFTPKNPYARIVLADGTAMKCLLIDLSESGAAISAEIDPEIGTVLAVGAIIGRVVRRFVGGFAVQFIQLEKLDCVEAAATMGC